MRRRHRIQNPDWRPLTLGSLFWRPWGLTHSPLSLTDGSLVPIRELSPGGVVTPLCRGWGTLKGYYSGTNPRRDISTLP